MIRVTPSDSADGLCLFAASDIAQGAIRRVSLPDDADEAKALLVADTQLYVATAAQLPEGLRTRVCSTTNLVSWQAVAELTADARAYSIELLDGYLYIGLGGDHPSDGNVYRAKL